MKHYRIAEHRGDWVVIESDTTGGQGAAKPDIISCGPCRETAEAVLAAIRDATLPRPLSRLSYQPC